MEREPVRAPTSEPRMRVLHVIGTLNRGGAETLMLEIVRSSRPLPVELTILCYGRASFDLEPAVREAGARVVRVSSGLSIWEIWHLLGELRPDVVHSHTDLNSGVVTALAWIKRVPLRVVHAHRSAFRNHGAGLRRRVYEVMMSGIVRSLSNLRIACGQDAGEAMFGKRRFSVIRNAVDLQRFSFRAPVRDQVRSEFVASDSGGSTPLFGVIARLEPVKNHQLVIAIAAELRRRGQLFKVLLLGRGSEEHALREIVALFELGDHVIFLGVRDDVDDLLNGLDAVLLPSFSEGFPVSAVEAQVNGVPILLSDQVDPDAVLNANAFRVPIDGEAALEEWASRLQDVIDGRLGRVSPSARALEYDAGRVGARIHALYVATGSEGS